MANKLTCFSTQHTQKWLFSTVWPFEGKHHADVALCGSELDTFAPEQHEATAVEGTWSRTSTLAFRI